VAEQIEAQRDAADGWQTKASPKTGNPVHVRPSVLVIYREDHEFLLDSVIPKPGHITGNYDLILARSRGARMSAGFKAQKVLAPLGARSPRGRLPAIQSYGHDQGSRSCRGSGRTRIRSRSDGAS
jgi:hypothetical protein